MSLSSWGRWVLSPPYWSQSRSLLRNGKGTRVQADLPQCRRRAPEMRDRPCAIWEAKLAPESQARQGVGRCGAGDQEYHIQVHGVAPVNRYRPLRSQTTCPPDSTKKAQSTLLSHREDVDCAFIFQVKIPTDKAACPATPVRSESLRPITIGTWPLGRKAFTLPPPCPPSLATPIGRREEGGVNPPPALPQGRREEGGLASLACFMAAALGHWATPIPIRSAPSTARSRIGFLAAEPRRLACLVVYSAFEHFSLTNVAAGSEGRRVGLVLQTDLLPPPPRSSNHRRRSDLLATIPLRDHPEETK